MDRVGHAPKHQLILNEVDWLMYVVWKLDPVTQDNDATALYT